MPELGNKFECAECGTKFYDLGKPEPACPKCGVNPLTGPEGAEAAATKPAAKSKSGKKAAKKPAKKAKAAAAAAAGSEGGEK